MFYTYSDVTMYILSYLDGKDKLNFVMTCTTLYNKYKVVLDPSIYGDWAIMWSIRNNKLVCLETLLVDDRICIDYNKAIELAIQFNSLRAINILLNSNKVDYDTAIMIAVTYNNDKVISTLLSCNKVDPTVCNNYPIRLASKLGNDEVVQVLLRDGRADPTVRNNYPIRIASAIGYVLTTSSLLRDCRVDPKENNISIYTIYFVRLLMWILYIVDKIIQYIETYTMDKNDI